MMEVKGIDVSRWQGSINWPRVASDPNVNFAIIKSGGSDSGLYTDGQWERNYAGAKAAGIPVGAYYFVGPRCFTEKDGEADAIRFISQLKGKKFEYPVYIDMEAPSPATRRGNTDATIAFCRVMEKAGYYVGIYASDISGFQDRLEWDRLNAYDKWIASYGRKPNRNTMGMWQFSSTGRVNGIGGDVDLDIAFYDFPAIMKSKHLNGY